MLDPLVEQKIEEYQSGGSNGDRDCESSPIDAQSSIESDESIYLPINNSALT